MKNKLAIGIPISILVLLGFIFFTQYFGYIVILILLRSLWEFLNICHKKGISSFQKSTLLFSGIYLFLCSQKLPPIPLELVALVGLLGLFGLQALDKDNQKGLEKMALSIFSWTYIVYLGSYLFHLQNLSSENSRDGVVILIATVTATKAGDAAAYFGGRSLGKHKLIPRISPNKSWEGLFFGYLGSFIALPIVMIYTDIFSLIQAICFSLLIATFALFGDLFESMFKRELDIKDTAEDIPGFGGSLDMVDSVLFCMPAAYWFSKLAFGL